MEITAFEQEIAQKIRDYYTAQQVTVAPDIVTLPENESEFDLPFGKARITVGYNDSEYEKDLLTMGLVVGQAEVITFIVTIQSRTLRDALGIYPNRNMCMNALLGFTPKDCVAPIWAAYFGPPKTYPAFIGDTWNYELHLSTISLLVQAIDPPAPAVITPAAAGPTPLITYNPNI